MSLAQRIADVRHRIEQACRRCGRSPSSVTLVAVTKTVPVDLVRAAIELGVTDLGENRVQEALTKRQFIDSWLGARGSGLGVSAQSPQPRTPKALPVRWHLIGHLQRNKAKQAVQLFNVIHSVDLLTLVEQLEHHASEIGERSMVKGERGARDAQHPPSTIHPIEVFVQVNVSQEASKSGCRVGEAESVANAVIASRHLRLRGLMTIAPLVERPEAARPVFRRLRELRDKVVSQVPITGYQLQLSMGMSHDFEVAIEEGADVVRIGTAIFGA